MLPGTIGIGFLILALCASLFSIAGYVVALAKPGSRLPILLGRIAYGIAALAVLGAFASLMFIVSHKLYRYDYAVSHTSNDLAAPYKFTATWSGQEGSFLLWASWTALIGFLVFLKAGRYEARVMPIFVSVLAFLAAILLKQSPFALTHMLTPAEMAQTGLPALPTDGQGLNAALQNYWMTIHPPTIFFGFASLAVPFSYAVAALIWRDYERWASRVMPYCLLSCATLGLGLFMGGYWAYETQGWHGFWGWDPVENASLFPWLAVTALAHGLVVQKSRGRMGRVNTFLGLFSWDLFLLGTFLTRSGALASKDSAGQLLSVHAFDNIGKSALWLMVAMLVVYGLGGAALWLWRLPKIPTRRTQGGSLFSRDFGFFMAVLLMLIACCLVTLGTTQPLIQSWLHQVAGYLQVHVPGLGARPLIQGWLNQSPSAPDKVFYNKVMLPLALLAALLMGAVPWVAWHRTSPDKFISRLTLPWVGMIAFGVFMLLWVLGAERQLHAVVDPSSVEAIGTARAWINPALERCAILAVTGAGVLAALSNAMLAFRVFRMRPLNAGGWIAHVGIGVLIIGAVVSTTFERTQRIDVREGQPPVDVFGYKIGFDKMTGVSPKERPLHPEFDSRNEVRLRVTPPGADESAAGSASGSPATFITAPRWFVDHWRNPMDDTKEKMTWPAISWSIGHDLYVGMASDAGMAWPSDPDHPGITMLPHTRRQLGRFTLEYDGANVVPQQQFTANAFLLFGDHGRVPVNPAKLFVGDSLVDIPWVAGVNGSDGKPVAVYLQGIQPGTNAATFLVSLPGYSGVWDVPIEVTYKPWINLVWGGVLITIFGALIAMIRRTLEARKLSEDQAAPEADALPALEAWENAPDVETVPQPAAARPAPSRPKAQQRRASRSPARTATRRPPG
jgi:cytochrome c-type biogenesis protein CcmF